jgi:hypothetical protein
MLAFPFLPETDIAYGQYRIIIPDTDMGYLADEKQKLMKSTCERHGCST